MTSSVGLTIVAAVAAYGVAAGFRLGHGPHKPIGLAAAFAPTLALLGPDVYAAVPIGWIAACAAGVALLVALLARRPMRGVTDALLLLGTLAFVRFAVQMNPTQGSTRFGPAIVGSIAIVLYSAVEALLARLRGQTLDTISPSLWLVLEGTLVSGFVLMTVVYAEIGWPVFAAMLALLAITKREFDQYVLAKTTLEETKEALNWLEYHASLSQ